MDCSASQKCGLSCATYSADAYNEFKAQSRWYEDGTGYFAFSTPDNLRLTGHGEPVPVTGVEVMTNFLQTLGVQPALGRLFTADDGRHGAHPVVLLENAYWKRQFAGDPAIVGKEIDLNGSPVTVVGVLPASFDFGAIFSPGERVDLLSAEILDDERLWGNIVPMIGRLRPSRAAPVLGRKVSTILRKLREGPERWDGAADAEGLCQRADAAVAGITVGRGWGDSADRLREPLQLATGAIGGAE